MNNNKIKSAQCGFHINVKLKVVREKQIPFEIEIHNEMK